MGKDTKKILEKCERMWRWEDTINQRDRLAGGNRPFRDGVGMQSHDPEVGAGLMA